MYSFTSRIRYSEVDVNRQLDLAAIINYFQDCSIFQSEDLHVGIDYLEEKQCAWMLSSWQIIVNRYPLLGEKITTSTWAYNFDSMFGYRNFTLKDENDEVCAYANSVWILVDLTTGHPMKLTGEIVNLYPLEEQLAMNCAPRKIKVPSDLQEAKPIPVVNSYLDTNNHVNNGQYVKIAQNCLPEGFCIHEMRADYRVSAKLGDTILPTYALSKEECTVQLCQPNQKPYAIIQFIA